MAKKGGYKLIDLKHTSLSGTPKTIKGIYDSIEASYGKPLLLTGIVIGGVEKNDVYVVPTLSGTSFVFEAYGKKWTVNASDGVKIENASGGGALYLHNIKLRIGSHDVEIQLTNSSNVELTLTTLKSTYSGLHFYAVGEGEEEIPFSYNIRITASAVQYYNDEGDEGWKNISTISDTIYTL